MRLTILGGGGFRVPLVHAALLDDDGPGRVDELVLHDLDPARLRTIGRVLQAQRDALPPGRPRPAVRLEADLDRALAGADFVFSAMRVGGLPGRVCDERIPLDLGVLGQETTGAGGVTYGLRTVPVAMRVAEAVRRVAPEAHVINFTNPAGMVTEAMARVLGDRVVGICDSPVGLVRRAVRALGLDAADAADVVADYAGLNHLGWLRRLELRGRDLLPDLLADPTRLLGTEEGRLFGPDWLATLGALPNEYLWYWYYTPDAVRAERAAGRTRGELLLEQQRDFWSGVEDDPDATLAAWEATRREREATYMAEGREASGAGERADDDLDGGGYDRVALALMHAIARDEPATLILNVPNRGTLEGLAADAVVEVVCDVDGSGVRPRATSPLAPHEHALVSTMKAVEQTTIEAALAGSARLATRALALHPLVRSVTVAEQLLRAQRARVPELAAVLGPPP